MGYYTAYTLTVSETKEYDKEIGTKILDEMILKDFNEITNFEFDSIDDLMSDCYKWYDCTENMMELSRRFPNLYFWLDGYGEDRDDVWLTAFHNGNIRGVQFDAAALFSQLLSDVNDDENF